MTATDELRRLLDGRGVEWGAEESELDHVTTWNANGGQAMFYESKTTNPNLLQVNYYDLTPAQAVEATLWSDLQAENAKLRELVLHMHTCLEHYEPGDTISCKQCPYDNETWGCDYERLMAELGIEVDA